jgi:c-di-GMP-binding flagellar brake protein YcgR
MMQEQRRYQRFTVQSTEINGRILLANSVEIVNISVGGALLKTDKRLYVGTVYILRLKTGGKILSIPAKVVRAELTETRQDSAGQSVPVYTCGMEFTNVSHEHTNAIKAFLKEHVASYQTQVLTEMQQISDLRFYVRFVIQAPETAIVQGYDSYKVKNISVGGICIEYADCLVIGEKHLMEIIFPEEKTIKFLGKVISCMRIGDREPKQYDIGIEFHDISEQDKEILDAFVRSLQ